MSRIYCRHYVLCEVAIILLLVSEFVVVVILSEWWLFYLSGGRGRPLPTTVGTSLISINISPSKLYTHIVTTSRCMNRLLLQYNNEIICYVCNSKYMFSLCPLPSGTTGHIQYFN